MKHRRLIGKVIITAGAILIGYASFLLIQNQMQEKQAQEFSSDVLADLKSMLDEGDYKPEDSTQDKNIEDDSAQGGDAILIDDNGYIGILEIPSLNLELPIQSEWSYKKLRNSPCAYVTSPLVIAAHNYKSHFGNLIQLEIGDTACFTGTNSDKYYYEVVLIEELDQSDIEKMIDESYDLTLFTCNYNNNTKRVVVRLNRI